MSFDRAYFVNTKAGFAKNVLHFTEKREDSCIILKYTVSEGGEYFLQYYTEPFAEVEIVSPINRYTPILHGEDKERLIRFRNNPSDESWMNK